MLADLDPSAAVTGGPISGADPQSMELIQSLMDRVFDFVAGQSQVTLKELIIFMKQVGLNLQATSESELTVKDFKEQEYQRIIEAMMFDQRIEKTNEGFFQAVNYNYPGSLISFRKEKDGGQQITLTNSRIVYTEIPCCHCPLAQQCSATDPLAVVNP